jgi:predicted DNA-binding transcriptional regulator AlpA
MIDQSNSGSVEDDRDQMAAKILRAKEVCRRTGRTGLSRTTIWRIERHGAFPDRRQLSPGAVGWIEAEVEAWIANRKAASRSVEG